MKLSIFVLSLNMTIMQAFAAQAAALAAAPDLAAHVASTHCPTVRLSTKSFVCSSLSAQNKSSDKNRPPASKNKSGEHASSITVYGVKLRPFVANRKLPSAKDIELSAQQPKLDEQEPSALSGHVSESDVCPAKEPSTISVDHEAVASYAPLDLAQHTGSIGIKNNRTHKTMSPYTVQTNRSTSMGEHRSIRSDNQLIATQRRQAQSNNSPIAVYRQDVNQEASNAADPESYSDCYAAADSDWLANKQNLSIVAPLSNAFKVANQAENMSSPVATSATSENGFGTAGPPPFPLNLLPANALKQLITGGSRNRVLGTASYFGAWHGNPVATKPNYNAAPGANYVRNLPACGFQSHIRFHNSYALSSHFRTFFKRAATQPATASGNIIAQARHIAPAVKVETYLPYSTSLF